MAPARSWSRSWSRVDFAPPEHRYATTVERSYLAKTLAVYHKWVSRTLVPYGVSAILRCLAVKGSGVRIPSAPPERQTLKPLLRQGFLRVWGRLQGEPWRVFSVESPRGVRESPQEYGVETLCGGLVDALEEVSVGVQGDLVYVAEVLRGDWRFDG